MRPGARAPSLSGSGLSMWGMASLSFPLPFGSTFSSLSPLSLCFHTSSLSMSADLLQPALQQHPPMPARPCRPAREREGGGLARLERKAARDEIGLRQKNRPGSEKASFSPSLAFFAGSSVGVMDLFHLAPAACPGKRAGPQKREEERNNKQTPSLSLPLSHSLSKSNLGWEIRLCTLEATPAPRDSPSAAALNAAHRVDRGCWFSSLVCAKRGNICRQFGIPPSLPSGSSICPSLPPSRQTSAQFSFFRKRQRRNKRNLRSSNYTALSPTTLAVIPGGRLRKEEDGRTVRRCGGTEACYIIASAD